ncbi:MAG: SpoIID/LytB domain-containing protein, partial [Firmicutes bacterium]|nr:SpoIID/LytB domain-containing protein [Bacillota bacterium]
LYYNTSAQTSVTVSCAGGFFVGTGGNWGFTKEYSLEGTPKITLTASGGVITGVDENGTVVAENLGWGSCLWPASGGRVTISCGGTTRTYRGGVLLSAWEQYITVSNLVGIEQYLYGVINAEMYHTNPIEALKAQAVAARSFACVAQNTHKTYGFDVCSTAHCQVYRGVSGETVETTEAVDATAGQCIRYDGEIVRAYYSSNNGGWIMDIKDAWGSTAPYLVAKADPYTPVVAWNATFTYDELAEKMKAAGKDVGTVTSVEITQYTSYGYVTELTITGTDGTAVLKGSQVMNAISNTAIRSQSFLLVDNTKEATLYTLSEAEEGTSSSQAEISSRTGTVTVLDADGNTVELNTTDLSVRGETQTIKLPTAAEEAGVKSVSLYGTGNGHSVGMSQDGAKEMARQGFTYDEILKFYYTGVEVY